MPANLQLTTEISQLLLKNCQVLITLKIFRVAIGTYTYSGSEEGSRETLSNEDAHY
jgi:hypothetical protein